MPWIFIERTASFRIDLAAVTSGYIPSAFILPVGLHVEDEGRGLYYLEHDGGGLRWEVLAPWLAASDRHMALTAYVGDERGRIDGMSVVYGPGYCRAE